MGQLADASRPEDDEDRQGLTLSGLPDDLLEPEEASGPATLPPGMAGGGGHGRSADGTSGDSVAYDLDDWSGMAREAVTERLARAGIPHRWEGDRLVVAAVDEAPVENILDLVEGDSAGPGHPRGTAPLDPGRDQVAYDVADLDDEILDALVDALDGDGIPYAWGDEELFVHADDEEAVDAAFDAAQHPDEIAAEDDEPAAGAAGADLLGDLFVAADRLQHDGDDLEGRLTVLDVATTVDELDPPYGVDAPRWEQVREAVGELVDRLTAEVVEDDEVGAAARRLRATLRPYV